MRNIISENVSYCQLFIYPLKQQNETAYNFNQLFPLILISLLNCTWGILFELSLLRFFFQYIYKPHFCICRYKLLFLAFWVPWLTFFWFHHKCLRKHKSCELNKIVFFTGLKFLPDKKTILRSLYSQNRGSEDKLP